MDTYTFYRLSIHSSIPALPIPTYLTLLIIETYTLVYSIFKISQFIIYKPSNII